MARRKQTGRPAKGGARYACGKLRKAAPVQVIPLEALQRRAEGVNGRTGTEGMTEGGYALGRAHLRGDISDRQFDAGELFGRLWRSYLSMRGIPTRGMVKMTSRGAEVELTEEQADRLRERFRAAEATVRRLHLGSYVFNALSDVLFRETEINPSEMRGQWVIAALDALADHYRLTLRVAA